MSRSNKNTEIRMQAILFAVVVAITLLIGSFTISNALSTNALNPGSPTGNVIDDMNVPVHLTPMLTTADQASGRTTVTPVVPEELESATLSLSKPGAASLVPYIERGFDQPVTASIAWWKEPGFYDNTTEYRRYLRSTPEQRSNYTEARRVFFNFITDNLDPAIAASPQKEKLILFRGISAGLTKSVLDNGTYIEPAYPSTSYDITLSLILFGVRGDDGYKNVLVLQRDVGNKSLYVNEDQREFILPRDTNWTVIKAVNVDNLTIEADFLLLSNNNTTDSVSKVRLIYIKEIA